MLTPRYVVGVTGHRSGFDESVVRSSLKEALVDLQQRAARVGGQMELYATVAEGSDTICVEVARELNMPVHLLLPLGEDDFATDFSSPEAWRRSQAQLALARQRPDRDSVRMVSGEPGRPECYFNQAMHMLDACDVLIAVWDGQPARGLGGTAQVIEQARAIDLPVVQISAATGAVTRTQELDSRFSPDPILVELNAMAGQSKAPCDKGAANPETLQKCLDEIAVAEAARFRPSLVRIILLDGIAALMGAMVTFPGEKGHWFDEQRWVFIAAELLLVTYALWMTIRLKQHHTQERWIRCRFACELMRSLRASVPMLDPLHPQVCRHNREWKRFGLSAGLFVLEHQATSDPAALRDAYLAVRLSDGHAESQIVHYRTKAPRATFWWDAAGQIAIWSARLAPVFVLLALLNKLVWQSDQMFAGWIAFAFLPIALPLLAGGAKGIRQALDAGRRNRRYPKMAERLVEIRKWLPGLKTPSTIRAAVARSEEILLDELIEWQLAMRNTRY